MLLLACALYVSQLISLRAHSKIFEVDIHRRKAEGTQTNTVEKLCTSLEDESPLHRGHVIRSGHVHVPAEMMQ